MLPVEQISKAVRRAVGPILKYNPDSVDEVVGDVFAKLYACNPAPEKPLGWAIVVGRNLALHLCHDQKRTLRLADDVDELEPGSVAVPLVDDFDPSRQLELLELCDAAEQLLGLIAAAIEAQSDVVDRELYQLHTCEHLRWSKVAKRLQLNEDTARQRYCRLLDRITASVSTEARQNRVIAELFKEVLSGEALFHDLIVRLLALVSNEGEVALREALARIPFSRRD